MNPLGNSRRVTIVIAAILLASTVAGCSHAVAVVPHPPAPLPVPKSATLSANADVRQVADANTTFGFQLLDQLTKASPGKNIFFSPFSVSNALTMLLNGAGGNTQASIANALSLQSMRTDRINQANALLLPSLEHPGPGVELDVANALWADKSVALAPTFVNACAKYYQATAASLDFGRPSAAGSINQWASKNTKGQIDDIVSPEDLAQATMVLTNAVYFHGMWTSPFRKADTRDSAFTPEDGGVLTIPMMGQTTTVPYLDTDQFQMVSLPYGGNNRVSMYVVVPKTRLADVINGLNATSWENWIDRMTPTDLALALPRFQVDCRVMLNEPLIALGMGPAFTNGADFAPMGLTSGTPIEMVVHEARIRVDENGTVASGVTASDFAGIPRILVLADRPFLCVIRDNQTGTLLFVGAIYKPGSL